MGDNGNDFEPTRPVDPQSAQLKDIKDREAKQIAEFAAKVLAEKRDWIEGEIKRTDPDRADEERNEKIALKYAEIAAVEKINERPVHFRSDAATLDAATKAIDAAFTPEPEQKRPLEPELQAVAASHDRRHGAADYSQLPQAQAQEKPIVQEFHAAAREVTEHKPTPPGRGGDGQGQSPQSPQGPAPTPATINRPMTGDEIRADPARHAQQQAEQRTRTPDQATPADASPATQRRSASPDSREQAKASDLTRKQQMQIALQRFTRDGDRANARENDGGRGDSSGRSKGR